MSRKRDLLAGFVGIPKKVRITRKLDEVSVPNGFILGLGRKLVLLQPFHDFYSEGFAAIRIRDIRKIRSGVHERHWEKMLGCEGLLPTYDQRIEVSLDDWGSLLRDLQERNRNIILECEGQESSELGTFYIGRIHAVEFDSVSILKFDALGKWDDEPSVVPFLAITTVQFDTPYITIFSKYISS
jgi:hypothetical protein